jgi:hypothetical protein
MGLAYYLLLKLLFTNCNLSHLAKISSPSCNSENLSMESGFIYRGQSNADWGLSSTYYRRFNFGKNSNDNNNPTQKQFQDYHKDLISDAKSYHYHKRELNDLELLLELQHYGAATGLVDNNLSLAARSLAKTAFGKVLTLILG